MNYLKKPTAGSLNEVATSRALDQLQLTGKSLPCTVAKVISSGIVVVNFEVDATPAVLPQITAPVFMSRYVRLPLQVGEKGVCFAADVRLGGMSGLGSGTPTLTQPGNLTALVFCPIGNTTWTSVDLNAVVITAPDGFVLQDDADDVSIVGNPSGITLTQGSNAVVMSSSGITSTFGSVIVALNSSGVAITGNTKITGNLEVTGAATFDSTASFGNTVTFSGDLSAASGALTIASVSASGNIHTSGGTISTASVGLTTHHHTGVTTGSSNSGGPVG